MGTEVGFALAAGVPAGRRWTTLWRTRLPPAASLLPGGGAHVVL